MTPERRRKVEELYHKVREWDVTFQEAILHEACAGDADLRREVERLLAAEGKPAWTPESPILQAAARMFEEAPTQSLVGRQLGSYLVRSKIGEGGMGAVYLAFDTKLRRDVALKVLPGPFAGNPERLARFRREAQLLASLNHKNIAAIYGVEETAEANFLVLELVEGDTFGERIKRHGPLPIHAALTLAAQVAEGLQAAHRKGITHRDIKPANIKVTPEGEVKILDFGLAKAFAGDRMQGDLSELPTLEPGPTRVGQILGTPAYMSPEQVRAQEVDRRTDIWAFGCVLYELLTGRRPFRGETIHDTISKVLDGEADWTDLPASTPPGIRTLLRRCLEKDAKRRLQDVGDARLEMEEALALPPSSQQTSTAVPQAAPQRRLAPTVGLTSAAVGVLALAAAIGFWLLRPAPVQPVMHLNMAVSPAERLVGLT